MPEKCAKIEVMKLKEGDLVLMELLWGTNVWAVKKNKSACFGIILKMENPILYNYAQVRWFSVEHLEGDSEGICPRKEKTIRWEMIEDLKKIPTLTNEIEDATLSIE